MGNEIYLVTSNKNKLKEFERFGLSDIKIDKGQDLEEVDSTPLNVIIYKSVAAGPFRAVEDTSLHIEGEDVGVNIRWLMDNLDTYEGKSATWEVLIGYNDSSSISVFRGIIEGTITSKVNAEEQGFGFDQYFIPKGQNKTLHQLEKEGLKDDFSARKLAVKNLKESNFIEKLDIENIPAWTGKMQK